METPPTRAMLLFRSEEPTVTEETAATFLADLLAIAVPPFPQNAAPGDVTVHTVNCSTQAVLSTRLDSDAVGYVTAFVLASDETSAVARDCLTAVLIGALVRTAPTNAHDVAHNVVLQWCAAAAPVQPGSLDRTEAAVRIMARQCDALIVNCQVSALGEPGLVMSTNIRSTPRVFTQLQAALAPLGVVRACTEVRVFAAPMPGREYACSDRTTVRQTATTNRVWSTFMLPRWTFAPTELQAWSTPE
jgi:hypothetical protein